MDVDQIKQLADQIRAEVGKAVIGQGDTVDLLLTALFSGGHILLEGPPGTAKTLLTQCFASAIKLEFGRIQFTPDLMPGDVLGTNLFNFSTSEFTLTKGPIFTDILLADEINRTPPKTQAALLEAMQEGHVTVGERTLELPKPFFVLATQNPIEQEGTYPLPEAQLDRFLFNIVVDYPSGEEEREIIRRVTSPSNTEITPLMSGPEIIQLQEVVKRVPVGDHVIDFAAKLARATRPATDDAPDFVKEMVGWGAGPRAGRGTPDPEQH